MKTRSLLLAASALGVSMLAGCSKVAEPQPFGPVPTERQLAWQETQYYAYIHYSMNTYTDQEWGYGDEDLALFNPEKLDCRQWARVCKESGMKGIILTAKHHCGFCLWPSDFTEYSVKNTPWKDGKGDIVRELADACKEYGLKLGIYLSPWDRNRGDYGEPSYVEYFRNQLKELLTNYGDVFEVWFDGANGGTGWYGGANEDRHIDRATYYDWDNTIKLIREISPNTIIWNEIGPDIRWCGTEAGHVGETNWSRLTSSEFVPGEPKYRILSNGQPEGENWVPAEVNTSIRPGWFYHPYEDVKVKTLPQLMEAWYSSIGRNGNFLLNFPIMPNGLISEIDAKRGAEFAAALKAEFENEFAHGSKVSASNVRGGSGKFSAKKAIDDDPETYWATDDEVTTASLVIDFGKPTTFNRFMVREYIRLGQRVSAFTVEALVDGKWQELASETTIGNRRLLRFPTTTATQVRLNITESRACPLICDLGVYDAPQLLVSPTVMRNKQGELSITAADKESEIYYTLDGSEPNTKSAKYTAPVMLPDGKVTVKAIAYEPESGKTSPAAMQEFDVSHKDWVVLGTDDPNAVNAIDGNNDSVWTNRNTTLPYDLTIDMGKQHRLTGFKYLPDKFIWKPAVSIYELYTSVDGKRWTKISEGEFSNIGNNPSLQTLRFDAVDARYIRMRALRNSQNNNIAEFAEIDVITE